MTVLELTRQTAGKADVVVAADAAEYLRSAAGTFDAAVARVMDGGRFVLGEELEAALAAAASSASVPVQPMTSAVPPPRPTVLFMV